MPNTKIKFQMRISPDTEQQIQAAMPLSNCQSKNEFAESALRFYCGYLSAQNCSEYLPPLFVSALRGTVQDSENRICRLLFKLAVELDMTMNILAAGMEIPEDQLRALRGRCVQEVKKTRGAVSLDDAVAYQRGAD